MLKLLVTLAALALAISSANARIVNGGFSIPDIASSNSPKALNDGRIQFYPPAMVTGWSTTDTEIEIWRDGANPDGRVINAPPGYKQFAEVNANVAGTLSQTVSSITVGSKFGFSFYHRGRASATVPDVLKVTVMDAQTRQILLDRDFRATNVEWIRNTVDLGIKKDGNPLVLSFRAVSSASNSLSIGNFLTGIELGENFLTPLAQINSASAAQSVPFSSPDGLSTQFRGAGDFYAARSSDGTFDLVRRQEGHQDNPQHTIITAVAVRFAKVNTTIEFYARPEKRMLVNGRAMPIPTAEMTLPSGIRITPLSKRRLLLQHEGRDVLVIVRPNTAGYGLRFQPEFKYRGGLMINMDGDSATDLTSAEEKVLRLPADAKRIAEFGGNWRVAANEKYLSVPMPPQPVAVAANASGSAPARPGPAASGTTAAAPALVAPPASATPRVPNPAPSQGPAAVAAPPAAPAAPRNPNPTPSQGPAAVAAAPAAPAAPATSAAGAGLFLPGEELQRGSQYTMNGHYLIFQPDGNLCVYTTAKRWIWCINNDKTVRYQDSKRVVFTREGALTVFDGNNQVVWRQPAGGAVPLSKVEISPQGALQIIAPGGNVIWSSGQR